MVGLQEHTGDLKVDYVGLKKHIDSNGRVTWLKLSKKRITLLQMHKIYGMKIEETKNLPTEDKFLWFYSKIEKLKKSGGRVSDPLSFNSIVIVVERNNFLRDSFEQFKTIPDLDLRMEIKIHFLNEICNDAGGLIREWFTILTEELFSPSFGLFKKTNTSEISYIFNENSALIRSNSAEYYTFCGQIIAKALFERIPIKAFLSKHILKQIVNAPLSSDDLKYYDTELWKSIKFLQETSLEENSTGTTFTVMSNGKLIELKEQGNSIQLKESNKAEFIDLFWKYHLTKIAEEQFMSMMIGFISLIPKEIMPVFDADELELLLCGDQTIDIKDWEENTIYAGIYSENHYIIKWFWKIIKKFNKEEVEKFLQFCTGSFRVPAEGFSGLTSKNGKISLFCIDSRNLEKNNNFIISHTCFNRIEVPVYKSMKEMEDVMKIIINSPSCFQFTFE